VRLMFIEEPLIGRSKRATIVQAYVNGVVQEVAMQHGYTPIMVHVSEWKKAVIGNGSATKERVAQVMVSGVPELCGYEDDQDVIDAAAIMIYGSKQMAA
jgi:Holliday junction resolvasome RuvABC endonuclease subunit